MATPTYEYSGVCYTATAGQTTFALTTSGGNSIGYLKPEHIQVRASVDNGGTWTGLSFNTDWVFADPATSIVLNSAAAADQLVDIHRETPMDEDWIVFQVGSLLTAGQLNEFETWQLYIDQELSDLVANLTAPDINLADTDDLPEGSTNLYYTDARVEAYVSGEGYIKDAGVTKIVAGSGVIINPTTGLGEVTIAAIGGGGGGGGFDYKGEIDATGAAPVDPENGDLYVNTATSGTVGAGWTGIAGDSLSGNERLIYSSDTSSWAMLVDNGVPEAPNDGELYGRKSEAWAKIDIPDDPVQSDWSESDNSKLAFIKNKPLIPSGTPTLQEVCTEGTVTNTKIQAAGFRVDQLTTLP